MPAYQIYAAKFEADIRVRAMSLEQRGAFSILLNLAWLEHGLPMDLALLARACGCDSARFEADIWPGIVGCFDVEGGRFVFGEMEAYRAERREFRDQMVEAGRRGGRSRRNLPASKAEARLEPSSSQAQAELSTASASTTASSTQSGGVDLECFRLALESFSPELGKPDAAIARRILEATGGASAEAITAALHRLNERRLWDRMESWGLMVIALPEEIKRAAQ